MIAELDEGRSSISLDGPGTHGRVMSRRVLRRAVSQSGADASQGPGTGHGRRGTVFEAAARGRRQCTVYGSVSANSAISASNAAPSAVTIW